MNTHESYVSIETAKMLKQAGFDWEVDTYYQHSILREGWCSNKNKEDMITCSAPTLSVAQKWLREVKNMLISTVYTIEGWKAVVTYPKPLPEKIYAEYVFCRDAYEEAQEAGIQKCLTILLEEK